MKRLIATAVLFLAACAQVGLATPQSVSEGIGYSLGTLAAVRTTTAQALTAKTIKAADAQQVQNLADQARTLLDASRVALPAVNCVVSPTTTCDTTTSAAKLQLATTILTQVQAYLATLQGAK